MRFCRLNSGRSKNDKKLKPKQPLCCVRLKNKVEISCVNAAARAREQALAILSADEADAACEAAAAIDAGRSAIQQAMELRQGRLSDVIGKIAADIEKNL